MECKVIECRTCRQELRPLYNLVLKGKVIDKTDTLKDARYLAKEYKATLKNYVAIEKVR